MKQMQEFTFEYTLIGRNTIENLDMDALRKAGIAFGDKVKVIIVKEEQQEVDFDRDAVSFCYDNGINISPRQAKTIALHFYGLGLSARKEAAEDREVTAENNALKWL